MPRPCRLRRRREGIGVQGSVRRSSVEVPSVPPAAPGVGRPTHGVTASVVHALRDRRLVDG